MPAMLLDDYEVEIRHVKDNMDVYHTHINTSSPQQAAFMTMNHFKPGLEDAPRKIGEESDRHIYRMGQYLIWVKDLTRGFRS